MVSSTPSATATTITQSGDMVGSGAAPSGDVESGAEVGSASAVESPIARRPRMASATRRPCRPEPR